VQSIIDGPIGNQHINALGSKIAAAIYGKRNAATIATIESQRLFSEGIPAKTACPG
jgi:hypothetical protein